MLHDFSPALPAADTLQIFGELQQPRQHADNSPLAPVVVSCSVNISVMQFSQSVRCCFSMFTNVSLSWWLNLWALLRQVARTARSSRQRVCERKSRMQLCRPSFLRGTSRAKRNASPRPIFPPHISPISYFCTKQCRNNQHRQLCLWQSHMIYSSHLFLWEREIRCVSSGISTGKSSCRVWAYYYTYMPQQPQNKGSQVIKCCVVWPVQRFWFWKKVM